MLQYSWARQCSRPQNKVWYCQALLEIVIDMLTLLIRGHWNSVFVYESPVCRLISWWRKLPTLIKGSIVLSEIVTEYVLGLALVSLELNKDAIQYLWCMNTNQSSRSRKTLREDTQWAFTPRLSELRRQETSTTEERLILCGREACSDSSDTSASSSRHAYKKSSSLSTTEKSKAQEGTHDPCDKLQQQCHECVLHCTSSRRREAVLDQYNPVCVCPCYVHECERTENNSVESCFCRSGRSLDW